jgi:putative hydrolase of the HAD superfamily
MIDALIFDLDDTLYPERDFVVGGYEAVASHIEAEYGCPRNRVLDAMMSTFGALGRDKVFEMVMDRFLDPSVEVSELVEVYRRHTPALRLFPECEHLLKSLRGKMKLGVITDGLPEVQKRKVQSLNLHKLVDRIIYTWEFGRELGKPHPFTFSLMLDLLQTAASRSVFVGDNLDKDRKGARSVGMRFVQVLPNGDGANSNLLSKGAPEFVVKNLAELPQVLQLSECYETV